MAIVGLLAALPTIVALLASPRLILDDIQFATIARFEGMAGFVEEMTYRPGQGLIHGLQFTAFGTNAGLHLLLLAAVNALTAVLGYRLLRHWLAPDISGAIITVWLVLPDRGSTRFWVSTVPNHVALALTLAAALLISRRWRRITPTTWFVTGVLLIAATVTYEAIVPFAGLVVLAAGAGQQGWQRPRRQQLVGPAAVTVALAAASLFVLTQSPRGPASTMLAAPVEGIVHYLQSLDARPLGPLGALLLPAALLWAILDRRPDVNRQRKIVAGGFVLAGAGLLPFLFAGFNVQNVGVLDRSMFFASIGTALMLGAALSVAIAERHRIETTGRHLLHIIAALLLLGASTAVLDDLGPYRSSWDDQARAAAALEDLQPEVLGLIDDSGQQIAFLVDVPIDDGVAWAHYGIQVQDLYQLVNDQVVEPRWLSLSWGQTPEDGIAVSVIGTQVERQPDEPQD